MVPGRAAGRRSLEVIRSNPGLAARRGWRDTAARCSPSSPQNRAFSDGLRLYARLQAILTSREFIQCNCASGIYPSSSSSCLDRMTASLREEAPSLRNIEYACDLTVFGETNSSAAISG